MTDRLAAAQTALNAGQRDEAIRHLIAAVDENPVRNVQVYRTLARQLYSQSRWVDADAYLLKGLERFPRDYDLLNIRGVILRKLKRPFEAVSALELAVKASPTPTAAQQNLGNVLLDLKEGARAEAVFAKLVRVDPRNPEFHRQLGRALAQQGKIEPALSRLRQAVAVKRDSADAWLDIIGILIEESRTVEALETLDRALLSIPEDKRLLESKVIVLRRAGDRDAAIAFLHSLLSSNPDVAWLHAQLGATVGDFDRAVANAHLEKAHTLEPQNVEYAVSMAESLERDRSGNEGENIERAYQLALKLLPHRLEFSESSNKIISEIFQRVCDFDAIDILGNFKILGRSWASSGRHTALLKQIGRVEGEDDRLELMEQHRIWGRQVEAVASRHPISRPPAQARRSKIRLGFMSSDLRSHPVGYFAMPLFDNVDSERFDVFVYSYATTPADNAQRHITSKVSGYRVWPDINNFDAAKRIANDDLDMLIELGGSTHMNKVDVMAYRPAPIQASWLGYPHSAGITSIDYFICDPFNLPTKPEYLIETPLLMPNTWLALGDFFFQDNNTIEPELPSDRNGFVTYGTANNPQKYNRWTFAAWAQIVAATPGSKFMFLRPEGSGASFRRNIEAAFAKEGVSADRLLWQPVRGRHLPYYNDIDVTLDPFPLTGGTTTTESLWMGVPLVTLVGEAFFERLSYSILTNAGLGDLCANSLDEFKRLAIDLAADSERRRSIRRDSRAMLRDCPLGQTSQFAKDFYDMVYRAVTERPGRPALS